MLYVCYIHSYALWFPQLHLKIFSRNFFIHFLQMCVERVALNHCHDKALHCFRLSILEFATFFQKFLFLTVTSIQILFWSYLINVRKKLFFFWMQPHRLFYFRLFHQTDLFQLYFLFHSCKYKYLGPINCELEWCGCTQFCSPYLS